MSPTVHPIEKGTRFGCGALVGLLVGLWVAVNFFNQPWEGTASIVLRIIVFAFLIFRYGERALRWVRWMLW